MKLSRHFALIILTCLIALWIIPIDQVSAEKKVQKGLINFDFPETPEAKIEINLTDKLISLVTKSITSSSEVAEIIQMLDGIYVRSYDRSTVDEERLIQYYQEKLKKEKWEVLVKIKDAKEIVEIRLQLDEDVAYGIFAIIMQAKPEEVILVNIVGEIEAERISELISNIMEFGLPEFNLNLDSKPNFEVKAIKGISSKGLQAVKVKNPPKLDGKLDDKCWKSAPNAENFTHVSTKKPVKDQTKVKLVYTEKAIYVGWYIYDSQPKKIVSLQTKDQKSFSNEDSVCFSIDTMHTHNSKMRTKFMVNPIGKKYVQFADKTLNTYELADRWNATAKIVDDGWIVEMEIPWSMLGHPKTTKPIQMGINFSRKQQRTGEHSWWSNVGVEEQYTYDGNWLQVLPPKN